jgi:hypothetical protein
VNQPAGFDRSAKVGINLRHSSEVDLKPLHLSSALIVLVVGCAGTVDYEDGFAAPTPALACIPGMQIECRCAGQQSGIAVCEARGVLGECRCLGVPPGSGARAPGQTTTTGAALPDNGVVAAPEVPSPPKPQLAAGVRIASVAMYQPVKIPLVEKGVEISERNAPVIARKRGLLRVFVETLPGYAPRMLIAKLELSGSPASGMPMEVMARIDANSTDADLESSLNFDLPAGAITETTRYSVTLLEPPGAMPATAAATGGAGMPAATAASDPDARWPRQDGELAALGAREPGVFRVVVVPYRYQADSSGRLPATDDAEMAKYREYLKALYPASDVELEVHEPVDFDDPIGQTSGWSQWLDSHCALREEEKPDPKVFYYGMIAPKATWREYGGGVAGVSPLPNAAGNFGRCSVGIGFSGFAFVAAHELGHALGLEHAPCGTSDGGAFPYPEAVIGNWAYDFIESELIAPDDAHDLMSYCDPPYMSDYNYQRLFGRIRYLNLQFNVRPGPPQRYHRVLIPEDGSPLVRGSLEFTLPPGGPEESRNVALLDAAGNPLANAEAFYFPFSEPDTGLWLVPDSGFARVRLDGVGDVQLY